jgi:hypothetical protein
VGESAPLWGRARPFGGGRAPLGEGMFTLTWWVRKGAPLLQRARPFGKGLFQSVTMNFNLLIQHTVSRWCSSGCVHEGCGGVDRWLQTDHWVSQIFFYRQPIRQASTKCPLPSLKQLNFWMQISSQLSRFPNSNNDHCDLGFIVTACDVVRRPYRGHEAATEDSMPKGVEGYVVPPWPWYGGEDGSADGAGR